MALEDTHLLGDPDDLRRILESIDARNEALDSNNKRLAVVTGLLDDNTAALHDVRTELAKRPTNAAVRHSRRRTTAVLVLFGLFLMFVQDNHVEHCSPGTRVVHAFDHLLEHPLPPTATPEQRQADFERYYNTAPSWCDVMFPLHAHDGSQWPTKADWLGMGLYVMLAVGGYYWQRGPREPAKPLEAAAPKDDDSPGS